MPELYIPLTLTSGLNGIYLKAISGAEEIAVDNASSRVALQLLDGLLSKNRFQPVNGNCPNVTKLVTADRDRVIAQLYLSVYGSKVESTLTCMNCAKQYDIDFSLHDLLNHCAIEAGLSLANGTYELEPTVRFRLPTGEDELLIEGFSPEKAEKVLMERCILSNTPESLSDSVQKRMAEIAPVLNMEMEAICPECGHTQQVLFDMQSFFLMKLKQERPQLLREIHLIASHYHWSHQEILTLPRKIRKQYVSLIEAENEGW
jgi:hypothetical protein